MNDRALIQQYLLGNLDDDDMGRLNERLCADAKFRRTFADQLILDCNLRDIASLQQLDGADSRIVPESTTQTPGPGEENAGMHTPVASAVGSRIRIGWVLILTVAASLLLVVGSSWFFSSPDRVATLVSSEEAAWVSDLPTSVGSQLPPGQLLLVSGIATLRFDSGATMILESPARLELQTDMRAFLHDGAAILDVPETAIGFVVATPSGEATDLGTSFAVNVDGANAISEFEVLKGSISVGLPERDQHVLLNDDEAVVVDRSGISESSTAEGLDTYLVSAGPTNPTRRIGTGGKEATFVRGGTNAGPAKLLMVKSSWKDFLYDRKAVFSFDASDVDVEAAVAVRLRLNQVKSEKGFANRLPPLNVFRVYGVANVSYGADSRGAGADRSWDRGSSWEDAPSPKDGVFVGEFQIPRSRQSGECVVETEQLTDFVRNHADGPLTFVVVREQSDQRGERRVLVHTFASHSHPSSVGPTLEFEVREDL
ncbi:FecR domain-containing protein [Allorhodopirellula solitaria]|uniref:FecR protein n=1 Tax=Allorhodopirellula solitaria TaxID=2527987 RepID=A0A5C5YJG7_9BACT|nr:FecR domain-containing protein [Allorhodopirellula solitaria]TWT75036.1 FecR protein [Allorhodopirellula solitaria]